MSRAHSQHRTFLDLVTVGLSCKLQGLYAIGPNNHQAMRVLLRPPRPASHRVRQEKRPLQGGRSPGRSGYADVKRTEASAEAPFEHRPRPLET